MSEKGLAISFVVLEPDIDWQGVVVTKSGTKEDWRRLLVWLAEEVFSDACKIRLVCDILNAHTLGALYMVLAL